MKVTITKQMREFLYLVMTKKRDLKDLGFDDKTKYDRWVDSGLVKDDDVAAHKPAVDVLQTQFQVEMGGYRYNREADIDITRAAKEKLDVLVESFKRMKGIRGHAAAITDIKAWLGGQDTTGLKPAANAKHAVMLLESFFASRENQRVYMQDSSHPGIMRAYHVSSVDYHPAQSGRDWYRPAYLTLALAFKEFGQADTARVSLESREVNRKNAITMLRDRGVLVETEELRAAYQMEHARWRALTEHVGLQCLGHGQADDDVDGNDNSDRKDRWYWKHNTIMLDPLGEPSKVVVDVFYEEEEPKEKNSAIDPDYWRKKRVDTGAPDGEEVEDETEEVDTDDYDEEGELTAKSARARRQKGINRENEVEESETDAEVKNVLEIPVYPMLAVFDMRRHMRLRVHIGQLDEYVYNTKLGERLILPADVRDLVTVLLGHKKMFTDVIEGKGGGVCILCAGPPGTGKTLTAEIYSEVVKRPLYAVQTAQLGLTADDVEENLRKVFARSQRWGSITLLDEADVYVRERGEDTTQNAIVGVFLRTLEYYQGILFLTTNRADSIDDAIASRCIARINYKTPMPQDQAKIWRVLADSSDIEMSDELIADIVKKHDGCSGRDIKNLIKLANMVATHRNTRITIEIVDLVRRFKPTGHEVAESKYDEREGGGLTLGGGPSRRSKLLPSPASE